MNFHPANVFPLPPLFLSRGNSARQPMESTVNGTIGGILMEIRGIEQSLVSR